MRQIMFIAVSVCLATPAFAADICADHPKAEWMTKEAITDLATKAGYTVKGVKEEDGCWEVKGTKDGARVEAYFDPKSGELVKSK